MVARASGSKPGSKQLPPHHRLQIPPNPLLMIISLKARQSRSLAVHLRRLDRDTRWSRRLLLRVVGEARARVNIVAAAGCSAGFYGGLRVPATASE
ncbi:hypothetical protein Ancab_038349, partial [Ancistrocladus abbreviatus]